MTTSAPELERLVRAALATRVGVETAHGLPAEMLFTDAGIDSLDIVYVIADVERSLARTLPSAGDLTTVAESIDALVYQFTGAIPTTEAS